MKKFFLLGCIFSISLSYSQLGIETIADLPPRSNDAYQSSSMKMPSSGNFHFIPYKEYQFKQGLPPRIKLSFEIFCNQDFVKLVRIEKIENNHKFIAFGAVVKDNLFSSCVGIKKLIKVDGGFAYSGKDYSVHSIKL